MENPGKDVKGLIDKQIELAKLIGNSESSKKVLTDIWNFAFNRGFYQEAIDAVKLFPDAESKKDAIEKLGNALIDQAEYDFAVSCIDEMPEVDESFIQSKNGGFAAVAVLLKKSEENAC